MATECPICGADALEEKRGDYCFDPPENIPGGTIVVPDSTWEECTECGEELLPPALGAALEEARYKRLGLLHPRDIKAVRERAGLTQTDMAQFVGVGEKTYTRWESGRSLQNRSSDNLIRLADQHPELFAQLEAQRDPHRDTLIREYLESLHERKVPNSYGMAAHGAEIDPGLRQGLQEWLEKIAEGRSKG